jgi:hypothetical protein
MKIVIKKKSSKLSCSKLKILSESDTSFEVVAYNFFEDAWEAKSRMMKKEQLLKNYE